MTVRRPQPPAPFAAPTSGDLDARLAAIAVAINGKASANVTPAYHSLALIDDTGQTWRLKVHADGTLHTDLVVPP
jgi:hypothetical protein